LRPLLADLLLLLQLLLLRGLLLLVVLVGDLSLLSPLLRLCRPIRWICIIVKC
jgi:hypothetical protein